MPKLICPRCKKVYDLAGGAACPVCRLEKESVYDFKNSDEFLTKNVALVMEERRKAGLEGMVGSLECVIINTEPEKHRAAAEEFLRYTGLDFAEAFEDENAAACVLKTANSADFLITARKRGPNPFLAVNDAPKSRILPNTRLETFVFGVTDIEKYFTIQKSRGVRFLGDGVLSNDKYSFIQTEPSRFTGNSLGFIQWKGKRGQYALSNSRPLDWRLKKPALTHCATSATSTTPPRASTRRSATPQSPNSST